jgi:hypothetical protein
VDNLAPDAPATFQVDYDHLGNQLSWEASTATDVESYRVHRDLTASFTPTPENLVATVATTDWYDELIGLEEDPRNVFYLLAAQDLAGNVGEAVPPTGTTAVALPGLPSRFALYPNVPNPFNPLTIISYDLPWATPVDLRIFDVSGNLVRVLVAEALVEAGRHEVVWAGTDATGRQVATGVYFFRLTAGDFVHTRRMLLVK